MLPLMLYMVVLTQAFPLVAQIDASPPDAKELKDTNPVLLALVSLALLPFQNIAFVAASPTASRRFTHDVLSVPRLVRRLPASVIHALVVSFPASLSVTSSDFNIKQMDVPKAILDNLLDLVNSTIQQQNIQISVCDQLPTCADTAMDRMFVLLLTHVFFDRLYTWRR
jgi:hypothetical protein